MCSTPVSSMHKVFLFCFHMQIFIDCGTAGLREQAFNVTQSWPGILKFSLKVQTILRFSITGSMPVFQRSLRLENCNTYFALINMKHFRKPITNWI